MRFQGFLRPMSIAEILFEASMACLRLIWEIKWSLGLSYECNGRDRVRQMRPQVWLTGSIVVNAPIRVSYVCPGSQWVAFWAQDVFTMLVSSCGLKLSNCSKACWATAISSIAPGSCPITAYLHNTYSPQTFDCALFITAYLHMTRSQGTLTVHTTSQHVPCPSTAYAHQHTPLENLAF